jgi:hypothetical protein
LKLTQQNGGSSHLPNHLVTASPVIIDKLTVMMPSQNITEKPPIPTHKNPFVLRQSKQRPRNLVITADKQLPKANVFRQVLLFLTLIFPRHERLDAQLGPYGSNSHSMKWLKLEPFGMLLNGRQHKYHDCQSEKRVVYYFAFHIGKTKQLL